MKARKKKLVITIIVIVALAAIAVLCYHYYKNEMIKKQNDAVNAKIEECSKKPTLTQADVDDLVSSYNQLKDKKYVNETDLKNAIRLRPVELAAIGAIQDVKSVLKSSDSFKLKDKVKVKDILNGNGFYYVTIDYSAQNGFGADLDSASCLAVGKDYHIAMLPIAMLTDHVNELLNGTAAFSGSLDSKGQEYTIDKDRILNNIDYKVS